MRNKNWPDSSAKLVIFSLTHIYIYSSFGGRLLDGSVKSSRKDRTVIWVFVGILNIDLEEIFKSVFLQVRQWQRYIKFSTMGPFSVAFIFHRYVTLSWEILLESRWRKERPYLYFHKPKEKLGKRNKWRLPSFWLISDKVFSEWGSYLLQILTFSLFAWPFTYFLSSQSFSEHLYSDWLLSRLASEKQLKQIEALFLYLGHVNYFIFVIF